MKFALVATSLIGLAAAAPAGIEYETLAKNASLVHPEVLKLCEVSENCEIRWTSDGKMDVGFQKGKEPGTADFARRMAKRNTWSFFGLGKRQEETKSYMAMGGSRINYGWLTPSDALNAIVDQGTCQETLCLGTASVKTEIVNGPCIAEETLILTPDADYPPGSLDNWMQALREMFSHEVETQYVDWSGSGDPNTNLCGSGTNTENYQSDSIGMNRFIGSDLQGSFKISIAKQGNTDCTKALAAMGAAVGFASGIAGGFFGLFGAPFCGIINS